VQEHSPVIVPCALLHKWLVMWPMPLVLQVLSVLHSPLLL
jgi:hypothetical protein